MSGDRVGEVVDFSGVETQEEAHGSILNTDLEHHIRTVASNVPVVGGFADLVFDLDDYGDAFRELYNGEFSRENLVTVALMVLDLAEAVVGAIDDGMKVAQGDLSFWIGVLVKFGLDWVVSSVQPVQDVYGYVMGNPGRLTTAAGLWRAVSENLHSLGEAYRDAAVNTVRPAWQSPSCTGAMVRTNEYIDAIQTTREAAWTLGVLLDAMADLSSRVIDFVNQAIVDIGVEIAGACEKAAKYNIVAIIPIGIELHLSIMQYAIKVVAIAIRAWHVFVTASGLSKWLEDVFEDMMGLLDLLAGRTAQASSA